MKGKNIARIILLILFISFIGLYILGNSSYYDYNASRKARMTEEDIKDFEERIANGEKVDINSYYNTRDEDYSNFVSNASLKISNQVGRTFQKIIYFIFNGLDGAINKK